MIIHGAEAVISGPYPLIIVLENDIAKVLGMRSMYSWNAKRILSVLMESMRMTEIILISENQLPWDELFRLLPKL